MLQGVPGLRQMDYSSVVRKAGRDPWGGGRRGGRPVCSCGSLRRAGVQGFCLWNLCLWLQIQMHIRRGVS